MKIIGVWFFVFVLAGCAAFPQTIIITPPSIVDAFRNPPISIANYTPWEAHVVALNDSVCMLQPGQKLRAKEVFESFDYTEIPVVMSFYDVNDKHFIGAWWDVLRVVRDEPVHREIRPGDVRYSDERQGYSWNGSSPQYQTPNAGDILEVDFPRIERAITVLQVYNICNVAERIIIDGKIVGFAMKGFVTDELQTNQLFYQEFPFCDPQTPIGLKLEFSDGQKLVGTWPQGNDQDVFYRETQHPRAIQRVIMPSQIQRY